MQKTLQLTWLQVLDFDLADVHVGDDPNGDGTLRDVLATKFDANIVVTWCLWGIVDGESVVAIVLDLAGNLLLLWTIDSGG